MKDKRIKVKDLNEERYRELNNSIHRECIIAKEMLINNFIEG